MKSSTFQLNFFFETYLMDLVLFLHGNDFSVDYNANEKSGTLNIHDYSMVEKNK